jgi:hypothetical protein
MTRESILRYSELCKQNLREEMDKSVARVKADNELDRFLDERYGF